jgi:hypothetical protein
MKINFKRIKKTLVLKVKYMQKTSDLAEFLHRASKGHETTKKQRHSKVKILFLSTK